MNQIDIDLSGILPIRRTNLDTLSIWSPMDFYTGWALQKLDVDVESVKEHAYVPNNYLLVTQT